VTQLKSGLPKAKSRETWRLAMEAIQHWQEY
jgi:hypothetical protein